MKLSIASSLAFLSTSITAANAGYWKNEERQLRLKHLWTNEVVQTTYWQKGTYSKGELNKLDKLLRDWRTGETGNIFYQLFDHLVIIANEANIDADFEVLSGFRSEKTNSWLSNQNEGVSINSLHTLGMAIDIRHNKITSSDLFDVASRLRLGGSGYYNDSNFVHIDVGPIRTWMRK